MILEASRSGSGRSQALRRAIEERDLEALRAAMVQYPDCWKATFCRVRDSTLDPHGSAAHWAVIRGWTAAFPLLWAAGDRFTTNNSTGYRTAFDHAVFSGKRSIVNAMLKLGVKPDMDPTRPTLRHRVVPNVGGGGKFGLQVIDLLVKSGADPWAAYHDQPCLPAACLEVGNMQTALRLIASAPPPQRIIDNPSVLWAEWKSRFRETGLRTHHTFFEATHAHGVAPSVLFLCKMFSEQLDTRDSAKLENLALWRLARDDMDAFSSQAAMALLEGLPSQPQRLRAELEQRTLEFSVSAGTPPAPRVRL
jgi:hypothetical protein